MYYYGLEGPQNHQNRQGHVAACSRLLIISTLMFCLVFFMPVHVCKYLPILTTTYRRVVLKNKNENEKPFSHQGQATLSKRKWETSKTANSIQRLPATHRSKITKKVHKPPRNQYIEWPVFSDIGLNFESQCEKGRTCKKSKNLIGS